MGSLPFERLCGIFSWRHVLLSAAGISALLYLAVFAGSKKISLPAIPKTPFSLKPFGYILRNPLNWLLFTCSNVTFCTYFIIQTVFGKKFLEDFAGFSSAEAASVIFTLTLVCMSTMLTTSFLTRLTGNRRRPLVRFACGLCAAASLLMTAAIHWHWNSWIFAVIYCMFAMAAGIPQIFSMVVQELNAKDIIAQSCAVSNMLGYMSVAVFSQLIGLLLDCFDTRVINGATVYSESAYQTLFVLMSAVTLSSFVISWKIPETRGHYLHLKANK